MSFGQQIRIARMSQGMTAAALARAAHLHESYVSRLENDKSGASIDVLLRLCRVLKVRPDILLEWDQAGDHQG
ncbi:MAG: hypothetical protein ETSY1_46860 (plasmid) [Candidatus Entotheonella factor]|uniref:HTH cro/C1-type domain-containing protein n=1 Tax=Entotheonella factor TaxID=1429438 RepID=W4M0T1_ENTF1|nr:MAG: hypothetical protein ETSY1_46860 [Candidatus Entotheonella factor]